ncbi:MAG: lysine--tRNA ligase [Candidatus Ranarchaeia archaeon]
MKNVNHWLTEYLDLVLRTKDPPIILNAGKSPSGSIHLGILRELMINDGLRRLLSAEGVETRFLLFIDDFDAVKHFPDYIPKKFAEYQGYAFCDIPDPYGCHENYAKHFAYEFIETLDDFFLGPEIIFTSEAYRTPQMKDAIRTALKKVDVIREIYLKYILPTLNPEQQKTYPKKIKTWLPAMVVCPKCQHLTTTSKEGVLANRVLSYDEKQDKISYRCYNCAETKTDTVKESKIKLTWRVDWPAKWSVYKVSVEPAGKDHAVKGGAYDTGLEISKRVFNYPGPVKIAYEWLRFGGRDMKTHKGIVFTPKEYLKLGYPEAMRQLILQTDPAKSISFRPAFFPQLIDSFIQLERDYYHVFSNNGKEAEEHQNASFLYPLCIKGKPPKKPPKRLPYRFALLITQLTPILSDEQIKEKSKDAFKKFNNVSMLTLEDEKEIEQTLEHARYWIKKYAPAREQIDIPDSIPADIDKKLDYKQKAFLRDLIELLLTTDIEDEQSLQNKIFLLGTKKHNITAKKTFQAVYTALINKPYGPRLAPFLQILDREWVIQRLQAVTK